MIKMVKAKDLKLFDRLSNGQIVVGLEAVHLDDKWGTRVTARNIGYHDDHHATVNIDFEFPIWYDDSNDGED